MDGWNSGLLGVMWLVMAVVGCAPIRATEPNPTSPHRASPTTGPSTSPAARLRIVMVGDSTMADYADNLPDRGWGQFVEGYFQPGSVEVINLAKPGRSTKTFVDEGRWQKALEARADIVIIQFGHNDSHNPANPESTDFATDFPERLRQLIADTRAAGALPILVTPMVRRGFDAHGQLVDAPAPNRPLRAYATAMKSVATLEKVALIDLHQKSHTLIQQLGPSEAAKFANKKGDITHFNETGARAMANLVFQDLPAMDTRLKDRVAR